MNGSSRSVLLPTPVTSCVQDATEVRRLRSKRRRQVEAAVTRLADHIAIAPITTYDHAGTPNSPRGEQRLTCCVPSLRPRVGGPVCQTIRFCSDQRSCRRSRPPPLTLAVRSPSPPFIRCRPEDLVGLTKGGGRATRTGEEGEGTFAAPSPLEPTSRHVAASYATYARCSPLRGATAPRTTETCGA
jgi:hypothetical protein